MVRSLASRYTVPFVGTERMVKRACIGWSLLAGGVVGIATGCLLAYLAVLPMFLGLFFFLLLGLIIGAVMFRLGKGAAPVPALILWLMGAGVSILVWGTGLFVEYLGLPGDVARAVRVSLPRRLTQQEQNELDAGVRRYVLSQFAGNEFRRGPADHARAVVGYLRWAATDGTMQCPRIFDDSTHAFQLGQRKRGWLTRVILSLGLLGFAVLSQVLSLRKPTEQAGVAEPVPGQSGADPHCGGYRPSL